MFSLEVWNLKKPVYLRYLSYDVIHLHIYRWSLESKSKCLLWSLWAKWASSTMLLFLRGIYSWLSTLLREWSCCQTNTKMSTATMVGPVPEIIIHCVDSHTNGGRAAKVLAWHWAFRVRCLTQEHKGTMDQSAKLLLIIRRQPALNTNFLPSVKLFYLFHLCSIEVQSCLW